MTEGKVFPVHTTKAYRGNRGKAPLILNFGTSWIWDVKAPVSLENSPGSH